MVLSTGASPFCFTWDPVTDRGSLNRGHHDGETIWTGSLLPLFWLGGGGRPVVALKPVVDPGLSRIDGERADLIGMLGELGVFRLRVRLAPAGLRFERMEVEWRDPTPVPIQSLHFGAGILNAGERAAAPTLERPFWPDWRAEGYGIASAKTNPMQSFFRSWDFGQADIPLGSFGPAMGTPYAAAFPRPLYAACLGGRHGWICLGAGCVPDAALTLQVRARSGALEWRYREDLWGAPAGPRRIWDQPLCITWADQAWLAYREYFRLFPVVPAPAGRPKSFVGTWGDFRLNHFDLRSSAGRARELGGDLLCIDDPWESNKGGGKPDVKRFPDFARDLAAIRAEGLGLGIWMPVAWIAEPAAVGLTEDDLLLSRDGVPVRGSWSLDPRDTENHFCLDPSSARARAFLRERTQRIMREYRPGLLKLDFGYGLAGPDGCAPRDPAVRGERLAWTYARLISEAAREIDPSVAILYYSLHPLWDEIQTQCSLDDLGDAGPHEISGHGHWSVWASLLGDRGMSLMASSGYDWAADEDVLLDSAVLGAPGFNLPRLSVENLPAQTASLARRQALFRWFRRTTRWEPLWLDSTQGSLEKEPATKNWGRLETIEGKTCVTALALREPTPAVSCAAELRGLNWRGRWIVLAQGDGSIFEAANVALVPFGVGAIELPRQQAPIRVSVLQSSGETRPFDWRWLDGRLHLVVDGQFPFGTSLGLLVEN